MTRGMPVIWKAYITGQMINGSRILKDATEIFECSVNRLLKFRH